MGTDAAATDRPRTGSASGQSVVRVSGEMDFEHVRALTASLTAALEQAPPGADIVVDLRYSSFCDSSGLNALLAARRRALRRGQRLVLAAPSHQMIRLLERTHTDTLFTYAPAVTD
ncbi:STAS domain-containing protein [Streptomyces sp. NPDC091368]|uniref:STAS domain-containing protein n=1 Tax=Streptomyces sp. NPDC091368 TaxID=3365993 RepID=UPI003823D64C